MPIFPILPFLRFWGIIEVSSQVLGVEGVSAGGIAAGQHPAPRIIEKIITGDVMGDRCRTRRMRVEGVRMRDLAVVGRASLLACLLLLLLPPPFILAQESEPGLDAQVEVLLSTMTIEERVGQLFLVTFVGNDPGPGSDIAQLIRQDRVGGVVLLAANSNFRNDDSTPRQVAVLANGLQAQAMAEGAQVPLLVAVDHEGDGYPYTRITGGTTPLPNAMAIGAAWNTDYARDVGQITGLELAAMGVNLLLGPSMDVLHSPRPSGQGDIGTRSFGGDPWWVGQMGRAYIEGVHRGSDGRVATVAKHFPGHGGSDRLPDEEVATVDKSVEELRQVELAPFMAVTGEAKRDRGCDRRPNVLPYPLPGLSG